MINNYLAALALEVEIITIFDATPDFQKTDKWLSDFKALCPASLLKRLFPVKVWLSGNAYNFTK
jgi:hypothetical protein